MKKIIIALTVIVTIAIAVAGVAMKVHHDNEVIAARDVVEAYVADIPGITDQDMALCRSAWANGGTYYHHFRTAKLTCKRHNINVDFIHEEE